ncbi:hypothetical protein NLI96_g8699 [Meripilus lineatus]|uniref:Uncharacterized protein n=1 Tax=Meripilus lineatus TaxID=2056292 RepID=A0AAD5YAX0_9APHY|nr:hypothetical protein NLI96_g8699 [Physisporinus lineatus]
MSQCPSCGRKLAYGRQETRHLDRCPLFLADIKALCAGPQEEKQREAKRRKLDEEFERQVCRRSNSASLPRNQAALLTTPFAQTRDQAWDNAASQSFQHETASALPDAHANPNLARNDLEIPMDKSDNLAAKLSDKDTALEPADAKLVDGIIPVDTHGTHLHHLARENILAIEYISSKNTHLERLVECLRSDLAAATDNLESERSLRRTSEEEMAGMIEVMKHDMGEIERGKRMVEELLAAKIIRCKELEEENSSLKATPLVGLSAQSISDTSTPLATVTNTNIPGVALPKANSGAYLNKGTSSPLVGLLHSPSSDSIMIRPVGLLSEGLLSANSVFGYVQLFFSVFVFLFSGRLEG